MRVHGRVNALAFAAVASIPSGLAAAEIPTGDMPLRLRADCAVQRDESNRVEVWKNCVSQANENASQSEPERRPRWVGSVESLGGYPVLTFDGKDDFLHLSWLRIGASATVILVAENARQTAGGSYWRTIIGGDDDSFREGATEFPFAFGVPIRNHALPRSRRELTCARDPFGWTEFC